MSKLTDILQALEADGDSEFALVQKSESVRIPPRTTYYTHEVKLYIAPKNGLYTAPELNEFMLRTVSGLQRKIKGLRRTFSSPARNYQGSREEGEVLHFSYVFFTEQIGLEQKVTVMAQQLTDAQFASLDRYGFADGKRTVRTQSTKPYRRKIELRFYPSKEYVKDALSENRPRGELYLSLSVPVKELDAYKPQLATTN